MSCRTGVSRTLRDTCCTPPKFSVHEFGRIMIIRRRNNRNWSFRNRSRVSAWRRLRLFWTANGRDRVYIVNVNRKRLMHAWQVKHVREFYMYIFIYKFARTNVVTIFDTDSGQRIKTVNDEFLFFSSKYVARKTYFVFIFELLKNRIKKITSKQLIVFL